VNNSIGVDGCGEREGERGLREGIASENLNEIKVEVNEL